MTLGTWSKFKAGFVGEIKVMRTPVDVPAVSGQVGTNICILL